MVVQYHKSSIRQSWFIDEPGLFVRLTLEGTSISLEPSGTLNVHQILALREVINTFAKSV